MTLRHIYEFKTTLPATIDAVWDFHAQPDVLKKLMPFPIIVHIHRDARTSLMAGEIEFTLWLLFIPSRWRVEHDAGPHEFSFVDRLLEGPVASWQHEHLLREVEGGVELTDRVTLQHYAQGFWALFTRLFFSGLPMQILFFYRHWRTRREILR